VASVLLRDTEAVLASEVICIIHFIEFFFYEGRGRAVSGHI